MGPHIDTLQECVCVCVCVCLCVCVCVGTHVRGVCQVWSYITEDRKQLFSEGISYVCSGWITNLCVTLSGVGKQGLNRSSHRNCPQSKAIHICGLGLLSLISVDSQPRDIDKLLWTAIFLVSQQILEGFTIYMYICILFGHTYIWAPIS